MSRAPSPKTKIAGSDGGGAADTGGSAGCGAGAEGCSGCATAAVLLERTWKDIVIIKREEPNATLGHRALPNALIHK